MYFICLTMINLVTTWFEIEQLPLMEIVTNDKEGTL